jgi:hypothetical protein
MSVEQPVEQLWTNCYTHLYVPIRELPPELPPHPSIRHNTCIDGTHKRSNGRWNKRQIRGSSSGFHQ